MNNISASAILGFCLVFLIGCFDDESPNQIDNSKAIPIDVSVKLPSNDVDETAQNIDLTSYEALSDSILVYRSNFRAFDNDKNDFFVSIFFALAEASSRTWEIRVSVDGQILPMDDYGILGDTSDDSLLAFTASGELDLSRTSHAAKMSLSLASLNDETLPEKLILNFSHNTYEDESGFLDLSLRIRAKGKGYFITQPQEQAGANRFTRIGSFYRLRSGEVVNRFNESLKVFPVNSDGTVTATSLSATLPLVIPSNIDGFALQFWQISNVGVVQAYYEEQGSIALGKIALAHFVNPQDLTILENTDSVERNEQTNPLVGEADLGSFSELIVYQFEFENLTEHYFPFTISVEGEDYLLLKNSENAEEYSVTKDNQYRTDINNQIINVDNEKLLALTALNETIPELSGSLQELESISLPLTSGSSKESSNIELSINLSKTSASLDVAEFDGRLSYTFNHSLTMSVFDNLGDSHSLSFFFVKDNNADNQWALFLELNDEPLNIVNGMASHLGHQYALMNFAESGELILISPELNLDIMLDNGAENLDLGVVFGEQTTQINQAFTINELSQNGYPVGRARELTIDENGKIRQAFSNDLDRLVSQLVLVKFSDESCLQARDNSDSLTIGDDCEYELGVPNTEDFGRIEFSSKY